MTNLTNHQLRDKNLNLLNNLVVSDEVFEEFQERRKHMTYLIAEFNHLVNNLHLEIFYIPVKQAGAEQCQAQAKLASQLTETLHTS